MTGKINLSVERGYATASATDENGCSYTTFEVDYFAQQEPGVCGVCGKEIESGWLCLDGGEEFCDDCVNEIETDE